MVYQQTAPPQALPVREAGGKSPEFMRIVKPALATPPDYGGLQNQTAKSTFVMSSENYSAKHGRSPGTKANQKDQGGHGLGRGNVTINSIDGSNEKRETGEPRIGTQESVKIVSVRHIAEQKPAGGTRKKPELDPELVAGQLK